MVKIDVCTLTSVANVRILEECRLTREKRKGDEVLCMTKLDALTIRVIRSVQLLVFRLNSVLWFPHVCHYTYMFYRGIDFVFIYVPWSGTWFYTRCRCCRLIITWPVPPMKQALLTILKRPGSSPVLWVSFCSIFSFQCIVYGLLLVIFCRPLHCLLFVDIRLLITSLLISTFVYTNACCFELFPY